jgi:hypothetical protein
LKLLVAASIIFVHSWYPQSCCGGLDCKPVPCEELVEGRGGWVHIPTGTVFYDVQPSQDRFCHVCINPNGNRALCAFIQMGT